MSLGGVVTHTLVPLGTIPLGYMDEDNIEFIQGKSAAVLKKEFHEHILFDREDVVRVMTRVLEERVESVPRMNQRVVMYLTNEFRNHQLDVNKHLMWEENYVNSQSLFDPVANTVKFDTQKIKLSNRLGTANVGGTARFYFT